MAHPRPITYTMLRTVTVAAVVEVAAALNLQQNKGSAMRRMAELDMVVRMGGKG